jgi:hypothetical protein
MAIVTTAHGAAPRESEAIRAERFARAVFRIAGVWGVVIMTPLFFTFDAVGRAYPPPITHPDLYYGFIGVTLVWQVAFLLISTDPARYRTIMIAAILEKLLYVTTMLVLYSNGHLQAGQTAAIVAPDGTIGLFFLAAFFRTPVRHWVPTE